MTAVITIVGNVGGDAILKTIPGGNEVVEFSVAKNNGKDTEPTWYRISCWADWMRAKAMLHCLKGVAVTVTGDLRVNTYTNTAGHPAQSLDIRAGSVTPHVWQQDAAPSQNAQGPPQDDVPFDASVFDED